MTERLTLETSDGVTLESRIDSPASPERFTVFCHPHPLQGGSMNAPLMIAVTTRLVERGHSVLRFNFRGTGASTGEHTDARYEHRDVEAAMEHARQAGLPLGLTGWSFGAFVAMRWHAFDKSEMPYVGIAPAAEDLPEELGPGPKRIILGTREQVVNPQTIKDFAERHGIDLVMTPGDHFFHGRGSKIGDLVGQGLEDT